jgi:protein-tyrosine kinase
MEKIRAAIEKARAERELRAEIGREADAGEAPAGTGRRKARGVAPRIEEERSSGAEAAWQRLPRFEPAREHARRNRLVSYIGGADAVSFEVLRTRLLKSVVSNNWRRIAITSPTAGCGKTTTCLNLAFSLSRLPEVKTLLIETDMRRPAMRGLLGLEKAHNISAALAGDEAAEAHMVRYQSNLAIGTNAKAVMNPAEILMGSRIGDTLSAIELAYEPTLTIFDTPPLLAGDDTLGFLNQVDAVLLIGAVETSSIKEIDICERQIAEHTNVLGVVLNKCRYVDQGHEYGYYDYA